MLEIRDVGHSYNGLEVIRSFSIRVAKGEFAALVGPSGCGKTTLFEILTGAVALQQGCILWQGEKVNSLRRKVAYMQQKDLLLPWSTLLENALLPARMERRREMAAAGDQALGLFRRLGLGGFENYLPGEVSGGMRQRCALVRTLMFQRPLVLLDEPLSAVDAITRRSLQALLLLLQQDFGKTIVMITHDVEEALLLADILMVVSRRPMQIVDTVKLKLPKPRKITNPVLAQRKEQILETLEKELEP